MQGRQTPMHVQSKLFYISPAVSHFYGTEYKIWAGFELVGSTENFELGAIPNPPKSDDWKWSTDEDAFITK